MSKVTRDLKGNKALKKMLGDEKVIPYLASEYITSEAIDRDYGEGRGVVIGVTSEIIEYMDTKFVTSYYEAIMGSKIGRTCKFIVSTSAYDNDPREVFVIPEYKAYIQAIFDEVPALFSLMDMGAMPWVIMMYGDGFIVGRENGNNQIGLDSDKVRRFGLDVVRAMRKDGRFTDGDRRKFKEDFAAVSGIPYDSLFAS